MIWFTQRFIAHHQLWVVFGKMVFELVASNYLSFFLSPAPPPGFHICSPICAWKRQRKVLLRAKGPLSAEVPRKPENTCEVSASCFCLWFVNCDGHLKFFLTASLSSDSVAINVVGLTWLKPSIGEEIPQQLCKCCVKPYLEEFEIKDAPHTCPLRFHSHLCLASIFFKFTSST